MSPRSETFDADLASAPQPSTTQPFHYDPLMEPKSEIRLLRILPKNYLPKTPGKGQNHSDEDCIARGTDGSAGSILESLTLTYAHTNVDMGAAEVYCEVFHVTMDQAPPYQALSYTWGSPVDPQHPIFLNGQTISVRKTLWLALKEFHTQPKPVIIWIDALCINQADEVERNEQVAKMKTIYEQATLVVLWLGPSYENSHLAFDLMQEMYDCRDNVQRIAHIFSHDETRQSVLALSALFSRDYWMRMWILQELVSAKHICLQCGRDTLKAEAFDETQRLFRAMAIGDSGFECNHLFNLLPRMATLGLLLGYRGLNDIRLFQKAFAAKDLSFFQCLRFNWMRIATDPRDMIYGAAALANSRSKYQINVDYSLSTAEIYHDLAKKEFQYCTTLEILTTARCGSKLPGLPSWVPDWSRGNSHECLWDISTPNYRYSAAGSSIGDVRVDDLGDALILKGVVVGKVESVGESPAMKDMNDLDNAKCAFLSWWALLGTTGNRGPQQQERFGRTLICDKLVDRLNHGWKSREDICRSVVGRFGDSLFDSLSKKKIDSELASARSWMLQQYREVCESQGFSSGEDAMRHVTKSWIHKSSAIIRGRRFFLGTSNIMGLAIEGVETGDIICVPLGCPQPMIFRKVDNHFVVIGEAYVDGYMYGKAMEMLENGELELETFELH
ncbi:hypothetical protein ONS96_008399 [Cadophora gregata f. sp. sojae]|nr:hypothetical protein ONS96_008399 [Cadophora gregata f. sp. sojae]